MKKVFTAVLAFVLLMTTTAFATSVELTIDDNMLYKYENGIVATELDVAAFETEGRTLVPVRAIVESFGADVTWNESDQKVGIKLGDTDITLTLNDEKAYVNGEEYILDVPAFETEGRTMVPIRFVSEALKYKVTYIDELRSVYITNEQPLFTINGTDYNIDDLIAFLYTFEYNGPQDKVVETVIDNIKQFEIGTQEVEKLGIDTTDQYKMFLNDAITAKSQVQKIMFLSPYAKLLRQYSDALVFTMSLYGKVTDETVENEYKNNYVCAKHILLGTTDASGQPLSDDELKKVMKKMQELLSELDAGADFDKLMANNSEDPGSKSNPDGYVFTRGAMVQEFEDAAFELKVGEYSGIVKTPYGYHIIKKEKLPELSDSLKNQIASTMLDGIISDEFNKLGADYNVTLHKSTEEISAMLGLQ